jgi:hypothetical protein
MVGGCLRLRGALLLATSGSLAPVAHAGAWSVAEGEQQWFATVSRESGDFGPAWRADDFTEVGLGDGWEVTTKLETQIRIGDIYEDRSGLRVGLQKAIPIGERGSVSVQASVLGGESLDGVECEGGGYEVRAAIGTSFALGDREGFVNIEAGHRSRDACERAVFEVAAGLEFAPSWNFAIKAWQDGGATGSTKAELNLGYDFGFMGVGVGWREEISGNFAEKGWVVSAQTRF